MCYLTRLCDARPHVKVRFASAGTDEIVTLLEDVGLNLQSMLTSRYVRPFADEVRACSHQWYR